MLRLVARDEAICSSNIIHLTETHILSDQGIFIILKNLNLFVIIIIIIIIIINIYTG